MTLPESETVDHPRKRGEKIQKADSHNTIKLYRTTKSARKYNNHTTKQLKSQHKTPHKSEENQAMDQEV